MIVIQDTSYAFKIPEEYHLVEQMISNQASDSDWVMHNSGTNYIIFSKKTFYVTDNLTEEYMKQHKKKT